jgi:2,5-dioxopentanoate dehydrogenase
MLTSSILESYREGGEALASQKGVTRVTASCSVEAGRASAHLFRTTAKSFLANPALHAEVFGPTSLIVAAMDWSEVETVIASLEGQLTVALHIEGEDQELAAKMLPQLECLAGRILVNGFGTGVEVGAAMVHGGPYPATSDGRSTSVGSLAIERFLRPVCYQDLPAALLPPELR